MGFKKRLSKHYLIYNVLAGTLVNVCAPTAQQTNKLKLICEEISQESPASPHTQKIDESVQEWQLVRQHSARFY